MIHHVKCLSDQIERTLTPEKDNFVRTILVLHYDKADDVMLRGSLLTRTSVLLRLQENMSPFYAS